VPMDAWLDRAARMRPERIALATADAVITYAELDDRARRAAGALLDARVSPGDRVALALPAGPDFVAALHGCVQAGAVAAPIDLRLGAAERAGRAAGAAVLVDAPLSGPPVTGTRALWAEEVATIVHTSGTTSQPRPVALSYGNWLASALGSAVALGLEQAERWLCPMPLTHVGGLSILFRSAIYGTTAVLRERFDTDEVAGLLSDPTQAITLVSLVPTMLARLLDAGLERPPTLRWALLGGGPIAPAMLDRARAAGIPVAPTYGMTEACSQIATGGWPLPGVELRIATNGEVLVRGPTVATGALAADGWLHTGDLGALDERGRLSITGRRADTIVTGGENVAPAEVEAILLEHPAVADAAVHGRPDPEWGEAIVAIVVLRTGASVSGEDLRTHCASRLARFKIPKSIAFADALPRTGSGKLLRRELG